VAAGEVGLLQSACKSCVKRVQRFRPQHLKTSFQARMWEVCHQKRVRIVPCLSICPQQGQPLQVSRTSRNRIHRAMMDHHLQPAARRKDDQRAARIIIRDLMLAFPKVLAHQKLQVAVHPASGASVLTCQRAQRQVLRLDQLICQLFRQPRQREPRSTPSGRFLVARSDLRVWLNGGPVVKQKRQRTKLVKQKHRLQNAIVLLKLTLDTCHNMEV
jgi:hypothetical protein